MAISLKPQHLNRYRQIAWLPHLGLSGAGDHFFFLAAAGGGIALLINILFYDKPGPD